MGRLFSIVWIAATLIINIGAMGALLSGFGLAHPDWGQPFYGLGAIYNGLVDNAVREASAYADSMLGLSLPWWSGHLFVIYAASASAIAASGMGVMRRESLMESAQSGGLSLIWPMAALAFVWQAVRLRIVSRFARDHSLALILYIAAVIGGYAGARYINTHYLEPAPAGIETPEDATSGSGSEPASPASMLRDGTPSPTPRRPA